MHAETLFEWKELLRFNVDSDPEVMYFDDVKGKDHPTQTQNLVTDSLEKSECKLFPFYLLVEVHSAVDFNEIKRTHLYQTEKRVTKPTHGAKGMVVSKVKNVGIADGYVDFN